MIFFQYVSILILCLLPVVLKSGSKLKYLMKACI